MLQKVYTTQYNAIQQVFVLKMFNVHLTHIELTAIVLRTFRINYLQKTSLVGKLTTFMNAFTSNFCATLILQNFLKF